ncbi:MAG: hypothetical protein EAZ90_01835 [Oscillatoriales cyanobacterium]|nr:MAG: hypothetical protein EAZ94_01230 [Oscillatoriales cyanobacterium]TAE27694.1 MAG: hypothetical protein EAZ93_05160 [Oscillatoriales cyanobacterium]TAE45575.1 MAG: hypothetical protein EAZ90_01835 [Oscillatoriales cyanobacterium]TAF99120.1 MAG: hypothetical protein EAZ45_18475 [Oscillatoriales cyanobacterium]TAG15793.1 MAG: hypothetical protein EAZ39_19155 [Oscillatoriales cyanobacterium]
MVWGRVWHKKLCVRINGISGIGNWELGIGNWALGIGHEKKLLSCCLFKLQYSGRYCESTPQEFDYFLTYSLNATTAYQ